MSRTTLLAFTAACFLLAGSTGASAQNEPHHPQVIKVLGPGPWKPAPQEISASYWTLEPGWNTELEMRNNVAHHDLTIVPALRLATGKEIVLTPVTLAAGEGTSVNLRDAVSQAEPGLIGRAGSFGSVVFRFASPSSGNAFAATIVRREGHPIDFHFDADDGGSGDSGGFEGIWWVPADTATDYLILSNPSSQPVKANLILSGSSGAAHRFPITIAAGQTQRTDIREVMRAAAGAIGGLSLSFPEKGELDATEIVFDEVIGLAAILKLFERDPSDRPKRTNFWRR